MLASIGISEVAALPSVVGVEFRVIAGFPTYCVGSDGSVWGRARPSTGDMWSNGWSRRVLVKNRYGYLTADLYREGKPHKSRVNRLVLAVFVGPCPPGMQGCHNDGDRTNNNISNLRWDTPVSNMADALDHGTRAMGERQGLAKLTEVEVMVMRARAVNGERAIDLAKDYNVTYQCARQVISRQTWKHIV